MRLLKILLALILVIKLLPFCLVYSIMLVRYPRRYLLAGEKTADLLLSFEDRLFAKIRKTWRRKKMKTVTIYTDGACSGNPGPGGWGAILIYGTHKRELSGGEADTTNNRMELTAVIQALSLLKEPCIVELWSDSKYVIDGLEKGWARGWQKRGWIKSDKKPALNPDLWGRLLELESLHTLRYHWVKGHAENEYNNRCDELAVAESQKYK
jgi:ribonuclease HI